MKFVVIGILFLGGVGALLWISVAQSSIKAFKVHEVLAERPSGQECRVDNGTILKILNPANPLEFTVVDGDDPTQILRVVSKRNPPDNFKEGGMVALRGVWENSTNAFRAVEITTKCPTKYEAAPGGAAPYTPPRPGSEKPPAEGGKYREGSGAKVPAASATP